MVFVTQEQRNESAFIFLRHARVYNIQRKLNEKQEQKKSSFSRLNEFSNKDR